MSFFDRRVNYEEQYNIVEPEKQLKWAYVVLFLMGGIGLLLGIIFKSFLQMIDGSIFLCLGYFVRKRSSLALLIAILIYGITSITIIIRATIIKGFPIEAAIFRASLLAIMVMGLFALKKIKNKV